MRKPSPSAAFVDGLLHAIARLHGSAPSPMQIARDAIHIEQTMIGDAVGCQDQVTTAHGGFNLIDFGCDESISVTRAALGDRCRHDLEQAMLLMYTDLSRHASHIAKTYAVCLNQEQKGIMQALGDMVNEGYKRLKGGDIEEFGRLLDEAWSLKRRLSPSVSNDRIDAIYRTARRAGAGCGYPEFVAMPQKEADFWAGFPQPASAPYSLAKRLLHVQALAYWKEYAFTSIVTIPGNVYGPHDNFDLERAHVVPALVRKFVEAVEAGHERVEVWGTGAPTRDFVYAGDVAEGMLAAGSELEEPMLVNLSSGTETSIREVVQALTAITGFGGEIVWNRDRPNDVRKYEQVILGSYPTSTLVSRGARVTVADNYIGVGRDRPHGHPFSSNRGTPSRYPNQCPVTC